MNDNRVKYSAEILQYQKAISKIFGAALREIREELCLEIINVSIDTGIPTDSLSRMERGQTRIDIGSLMIVLSQYGVSLQEFYNSIEEKIDQILNDLIKEV